MAYRRDHEGIQKLKRSNHIVNQIALSKIFKNFLFERLKPIIEEQNRRTKLALKMSIEQLNRISGEVNVDLKAEDESSN